LFEAPLSVLCTPQIAAQLQSPADLLQQTLLRSYRTDEWTEWFIAAGVTGAAQPARTVVFDSSLGMMEAAQQGVGVALAPPLMFERLLASDAVRQPFAVSISTGSYWLTRLQSRAETTAMLAFKAWLCSAAAAEALL
jgi:LysR family transcriptional regulator of beta-lactamase